MDTVNRLPLISCVLMYGAEFEDKDILVEEYGEDVYDAYSKITKNTEGREALVESSNAYLEFVSTRDDSLRNKDIDAIIELIEKSNDPAVKLCIDKHIGLSPSMFSWCTKATFNIHTALEQFEAYTGDYDVTMPEVIDEVEITTEDGGDEDEVVIMQSVDGVKDVLASLGLDYKTLNVNSRGHITTVRKACDICNVDVTEFITKIKKERS